MDLRNISSEDVSSYSILCDSPLNSDKNKHSNKNNDKEKTLHLNIDRMKTERLNSLKKLRPVSEPSSLKRSIESFDLRGAKNGSAKFNSKGCSKNNLKVFTRKLKLTNRQVKRIESLSTNSAASRYPSFSKKETCQISNKNKEKYHGKIPLSETTDNARCSPKIKKKEIIEIEIFMPVIDAEKNTITYPKSKIPIVKRYYLNEKSIQKPKDNIPENIYSNKKNNESTCKKFHLHSKKPKNVRENSNKNISEPKRKWNETNAVRSAFVKKTTPAKDLRPGNAKVLEKQKVVAQFQNLLKDITIDTENIPRSHSKEGSKYTNISHKEVYTSLSDIILENSSTDDDEKCNSKAISKDKYKKVMNEMSELHSDITYNILEENDITQCQRFTEGLKENDETPIQDAFKKVYKKIYSQQKKKGKFVSSHRDTKLRTTKPNKQNLEESAFEVNELNSSAHDSMVGIKSNENGWRRTIKINSLPRKCSSSNSNWSRNIKDDGISMESWIERCKYLQSNHQCLQMKTHLNNWRPS